VDTLVDTFGANFGVDKEQKEWFNCVKNRCSK
jgi:hypothetical protein